MKHSKKSLIAIATLILLSSALSACYTMQGAGRDISATGHTITRAASY